MKDYCKDILVVDLLVFFIIVCEKTEFVIDSLFDWKPV